MSDVTSTSLSPELAVKLRHYPAAAVKAFARWQETHRQDDLAVVVQCIMQQFSSALLGAGEFTPLPPETELIAGLGLDSLGIAEAVFCAEDILGVKIDNEELRSLSTLGALTYFLHRKTGGA